ncbi:putative transporter SEO1 [Wickerhamomyces ciferrii]|uniref:Transporter SEO1 n=1 Tax=Wickerhamomyces ciferrii (strain ATCC 14091 / BCRC 22168 / CBS 111 / JCM 3599 / NBRC 0793 / NRRL Y-1031 F-60-10) TaxID=1206466 RepID=K0KNG3_WICCF|nr:putative transporter SEO1 [Wickerhamomyces ciferrii]CCH46765.1 putative transporter SEO1 [Wickerhamomyces ciferrii]
MSLLLTLLYLSEWFGTEGMSKRMFMLDGTSALSSMFAGYIQAGVYTTMNGRYGLPGWKWVFLVDGFISIPVAFIGFYCLPDFPQNSRAPWLTKKDRQFALARAKKMGRVKPEALNLKQIFEVAINPKLWLFVALYVFGVIGCNAFSYFSLFLKSLGTYSVQQINIIPTAGNAVQFVTMFIYAVLSDINGNRILWVSIAALVGIFSCLLLSIWDIPFKLLMFAFIFGSGSISQTMVMGWFAEVYYDEPNLKTVNIALGNVFTYTFNAFLPLAIYKTKDAPHFKIGYKVSLVFYILGLIFAWIFWYVTRKHTAKRNKQLEIDSKSQLDQRV